MLRKCSVIFGCVVIIFHCNTVHANSFFPEERVEELQLKNGMTFLLMPHGETPVFSAYIRIRVGGIDEPDGLTGVSHVIEHMAFKGTKKWGTRNWEKEKEVLAKIEVVGQKIALQYAPNHTTDQEEVLKLKEKLNQLYEKHQQWIVREELTKEYQRRGGLHANATTSQDITTYFISLPSSEIEFWAKVEAERIFEPVFREFYREKDVVLEERRTRVIDDPSGAFYTQMLEASFPKSRYARPTIGYEKDLLTLTRTKAEKFFEDNYRPDRAVGAIVGRFDVESVKELLKKTFGRVPQYKSRVPGLPSTELRAGESRVKDHVEKPPYNREGCRVDLSRIAQPRLSLGFHKPNLPSRDDYIFDLIATLLIQDRSSRLYRSLVIEKSLATSVRAYAGIPGSRLPNMFMIFAVPRPGVPLDRLAEEVMGELERLKKEIVPENELRRARKQLLNDQIWRLEKNDSLAAELSYFQAIAGDWRYIARYEEVLKSITPKEIREAAQKYLVEPNRCLGFLHREEVKP